MASLEDRITKPEPKEPDDSAADSVTEESSKHSPTTGMNATATSYAAGQQGSWADDVNSPADANPPAAAPTQVKEAENDLAAAQIDGAGEFANGTAGVYEPSYDVDVKLNDIQADPNNPLYSVKSFEELNL